MGKFYLLLLFLSIVTFHVQAQNLGEYTVTVEIIKACGYGRPDGAGHGGKEEYRWKFWGRLEGETDDQWIGGDAFGLNDANGGDCIDADTDYLTANEYIELPYKIFERTYFYTPGQKVNINIRAEGYEKDCFPSNSDNGHDFNYKEECHCDIALGATKRCPEKDDNDHRIIEISESLKIEAGGVLEFPATYMGDKYSFEVKYTITPPITEYPQFAYSNEFIIDNPKASSTELLCANKAEYFIFWNLKNEKIEELIWYENTNNEKKEIFGIPINQLNWRKIKTTTKNSEFGLYAIKLETPEIASEEMKNCMQLKQLHQMD